jgi:hypothetical protein
MKSFNSTIEIIGVNPYVRIPDEILEELFISFGRNKGPIQVKGTIEGYPYIQTLVKYGGLWRLYINGPMLRISKKKVNDEVHLTIAYDPSNRTVPMHPALQKALDQNKIAKKVFQQLSTSRKKEINRYIFSLKTKESVERNIEKAIRFLNGDYRFVGRDHP